MQPAAAAPVLAAGRSAPRCSATVFGHRLFGPMEGHAEGMPRHYDRHAWVWLDNPAGTWSDFTPDVSCP